MDMENVKENSFKVSSILKVLSHPQRLCLLCHLHDGRKTVGELQELCEISQSHVSQFLGKMKRQELVASEKEGNFVYYSLADSRITDLLKSLNSIYCTD